MIPSKRKDPADGAGPAHGGYPEDHTDPAAWLAGAARTGPERLFLRAPGGYELTYAALYEQTRCFAAALGARGVAHGDFASR